MDTQRLRITSNTVWAFLCLLLYRIVLDISYYFIISTLWSYSKFELHLDGLKLVESYFLFLLVFILMPKSTERLSSIFVWLLIILSYIPMLTLFAFADENRAFMYAVSGFWVAVLLLLRMPGLSLPPLRQSGIIRWSLFIGFTVTVILLVHNYLGLSFNLDLGDVYNVRGWYVAAQIPWAGYLFNWFGYIVNPVFFALFIRKRKWLLVALIVFLQFWLFSVTGLKTFLFALPFVLALMWIMTRRKPLCYIAVGFAGVVVLGMLSYWLIEDVWILSLGGTRTLFRPAQLSFFYYDFFSTNELVFLSASRLGFFLDYPYHLSPPNLIAEVYFGKPEMTAVTGITGDAYMNFGFAGLALWGIMLAIILKLVDSCAKRVDLIVGIAAIAIPAVILANSGLTTSLLTHGLLLALLLLYLLPNRGQQGV
jgi:hypothetical protein